MSVERAGVKNSVVLEEAKVESPQLIMPLFDETLITDNPYVAQVKLRDYWTETRLISRNVLCEGFLPDEMIEQLESDAMHMGRAIKELAMVSGKTAKYNTGRLIGETRFAQVREVERVAAQIVGDKQDEFVRVAGSFVTSTRNAHIFESFSGSHFGSDQLTFLIGETGGIPQVPVAPVGDVAS